MMLTYQHLDTLILLCVVFAIPYLQYRQRKRLLPLPPGPRGLPIIGNVFQLPQSKHWEVYKRWTDKYGDVVYLHQCGRPFVILNSFKSVYELLERRSSIYSSRPHYVMFHDLMDFGGTTTFRPYGSIWRDHRAMWIQQLNTTAMGQFMSIQVNAVRALMRLLVKSPEDFAHHVSHFAATVAVNFAYGYNLEVDDPIISLIETRVALFSKAVQPGAYLVDSFPFLKHLPAWFPGTGFMDEAKEARMLARHTRDIPFQDVKNELKTGKARPSFVANSLLKLGIDDDSNPNVESLKRLAGGIMGAGTSTTASTFLCFMNAMALYPNVMKKAQAELDSVVGKGNLPEFSDRPLLPYLSAVMKETLRWLPVVPTAFPHVTISEDVYDGYRIPAGSHVIPNTWLILHDPEIYSDPMVFRPERFLPGKDGKPAERDPAVTGCFGFGRRICAGRKLANDSLWLAMASLLSTFDISDPIDENGKPIPLYSGPNAAGGILCGPQKFSCSITVRSKEVETLLKSTS